MIFSRKNILPRILAFVICAVLIFENNVSTAFADEIIESGSCGTNVNYYLYDNGFLIVNGSGDMTSRPWQTNHEKDITSVHIVGDVTSIYSHAFSSYSSKNTIAEIGKKITVIGDNAFFDNKKLTIVHPEGKQWTDYAQGTFDIPGNVKTIKSTAFYYNESLKNLIINEGTTEIGSSAFRQCYGLETVKLPSTLTSIGNEAFYDCTKLKSINIPKNLSTLGKDVFYNCKALENITVDAGCEKYRISNGALVDNRNDSIYIYPAKRPDTTCVVENGIKRIEKYAFKDNPNIENLYLPEGLKVIDYYGCQRIENIKTIYIPKTVIYIGERAFGSNINVNGKDRYWYKSSYYLTTVEDEIKNIPTIYYGGTKEAFEALLADGNNKALEMAAENDKVVYGHKHTYTLKEDTATADAPGKETFACSCGLTAETDVPAIGHESEVNKPNNNTKPSNPGSTVVVDKPSVGKEVDVNGNTYVITKVAEKGADGEVAFAKASSKKSIDTLNTIIINDNTYKVTEINAKAFMNKKKLTKVTIGKNIKKIGKKAFYGCKRLKKITVSTKKLTLKSVGSKAFTKIHKKAVVKVPKKKYKLYKKIFKKRGMKKKSQKVKK